MAQYPSAVPSIDAAKQNSTTMLDDHKNHHNQLASELVAVAQELGTLPKGSSGSVKARLDSIATRLDGHDTALTGLVAVEEISESNFYLGLDSSVNPPVARLPLGGTMIPIHIAKYPLVVKALSIAIMNPDAGIPASNTNYWSVLLTRIRADANATIASKTTQATGGAAITDRRTDWNFDAVSFNATSATCQAGDIIAASWTSTGSPVLPIGIIHTVRYEPA